MGMTEPEDRIARLVAALAAGSDDMPKSVVGRAWRAGAAALRTGSGVLFGRLRGGDLDARTLEKLALSLGELKGIAMKVGQILSYLDTPLPEEARRVLAVLQVQSQPVGFDKVEAIVREDFKERAQTLIDALDRTPVATASIGQVYRGRLDGVEVAVKVLHPGIEEAIRSDFKAASAGKMLAKMLMPGGEIDAVIEEAREAFLGECDYESERTWQERFRAIYLAHPSISVPAVQTAWCSKRVLTTRWQTGMRFDDFVRSAEQPARDRAGTALYEFYVGSVYRYGLFNADPHPGNLLFQDDGRLTVLDHGCVREFDPGMRRNIARLSRAVRADDPARIRAALVALGGVDPDDKVFPATRSLLRGFFGPVLSPGPHPVESGFNSDLRVILADKRGVIRMRLPGRLLFLFRIRFGLHSELAKLGAVADWQAIEEQACAEVPV
jgi:predicted unusual protein kinase regulating ubiquinone biosynthesis (AarF/ABC1/UbiB family)